jgi:hypothetical protein
LPALLPEVAVVDSAGWPLTTNKADSLFTSPLYVDVNDGSGCPYGTETLVAVTLSTAGEILNDCTTEAALYVLLAGADAVMVHTPTPVMPPLAVHGPDAVKLTARPDEDDALNENVPPYATPGNCGKRMVCDCRLDP